MSFQRIATVMMLLIVCNGVSAAPISGSLEFVAVGEFVETDGIVTGFDFTPTGTSFNNPGLLTTTSGAVRDVLGVRGLFDGVFSWLQVYDFDLATLPALEWVLPVAAF